MMQSNNESCLMNLFSPLYKLDLWKYYISSSHLISPQNLAIGLLQNIGIWHEMLG
ncbi:MAG: hypothetical protein FWE22_00115 [Firmicutes bacterium]|nr:hypothetical protein [Bacillota bacterium]